MIWVSSLSRNLLILLAVLLVSGCGSKAVVKEPIPLVDLAQQQLKVNSVWDFSFAATAKRPPQQMYQAAFSAGRVYTTDIKGVIRALGSDRAKRLWDYPSGLKLTSGMGYGEGLVVAGSRDGDVLALNAESGALAWQARVSSEVLTTPVIDDGIVFIRSVDGKVAALNVTNGERLWTYQETVPSLSLHGLSVPLVDRERVYVGFADGRIAALNKRDGAEQWLVPVALPQGRTELERLIDVDANLVQYENFLYATAYNGRLVAIDKRTGRVAWMRDLSSYRGLLVDGQAIYMIDDQDAVWALSRRNGATLWKTEGLLQRSLSAPILVGDQLVVGDVEGYVHWLNCSDGSFAARTRTGMKAVNQVQLDQDNVIYITTVDGHLYSLRTDINKVQVRQQQGGAS